MARKIMFKTARTLSMLIWNSLAETGISNKRDLPYKIYHKVNHFPNECPLCSLFWKNDYGKSKLTCPECPLTIAGHTCRDNGKNYYDRWCRATSNAGRKKNAKKIFNILEAWEV